MTKKNTSYKDKDPSAYFNVFGLKKRKRSYEKSAIFKKMKKQGK